jgi:hypothetical protein
MFVEEVSGVLLSFGDWGNVGIKGFVGAEVGD